jgi:membrane protein implicated in regulation of membrane protease activity
MHPAVTPNSLKVRVLTLLKRHPVKTLFFYSLSSELLILLFLFLAFLLTAEILLPGFISLRLNLTWYLIAVIAATSLLLIIGKTQSIQPSQIIHFEKPILLVSGLWACGIVAFSLHHFPWWTIVLLLILVSIVSLWAWRLFFKNTEAL